MPSKDLTERLKHATGVDPVATWNQYTEETGNADEREYVDWLRAKNTINNHTWTALASDDALEVDLSARLASDQRYTLQSTVGTGAMGEVFVATDHHLGRQVAFKRLHPEGLRPDSLRRFLNEAQVTAQLDHPNIVPVHSLEDGPDGAPAYTMKLVRGDTLAQRLHTARELLASHGRVPPEHGLAARLDVFVAVCDAIAYAHSKNVVHRDLKPDNIMVGRFHDVYVMDWGIARINDANDALETRAIHLTEGTATGTKVGAIVGTPAYMAPEQAVGEVKQIGPWTDVFSLGLVLYEVALLKICYDAPSGEAALMRAAYRDLGDFTPVEGLPPLPAPLRAILDKALSLAPLERYRDAGELGEDVRRWLHNEEVLAYPDTPYRRLMRLVSRHPRTAMSIGFLSVMLVGSIGVGLYASARIQVAEAARVEEHRQQQRAAFAGAVADQARTVDNHFLWYAGHLESLAGAATHALTRGVPVERTEYSAADYRDEERAPPRMIFSEHYQRPISPKHPVYKVAPGVPEELWRHDLALVSGVEEHLRRMFLTGPDGQAPPAASHAQDALITGDDVPMEWAYVAVDRSGLMLMFPGAEGWDEAYDARTRPWYRETVGTHGRRWTKPYVDLMGQGRLISATRALYGPDGTFLGVAGIDLEFHYVVDRYMPVETPGFSNAFLVAPASGRVMISTAAIDLPFVVPPTAKLDDGLNLGTLDRPNVLDALREGRSGHIIDGDQIVAWSPLPNIGWGFVAVGDRATVDAQ